MVKRKFEIAKDGVDPKEVPVRVLYDGNQIPAIGLGTFGSDKFSGENIAKAVLGAAEVGYRHFDCASVYGNQSLIGESLQEIMKGEIKRKDIWVNSKLWNDSHSNVIPSCKKTLQELKLDYLDVYFIHWPFPNYHEPGANKDSRDPNAKQYIHEDYMQTWFEMEKLVGMGLIRYIGTSNMTIKKLDLLLKDAIIQPACNQMELHPHFQQPELFNYCVENDMVPVGFAPIGSPTRPDRDRSPSDSVDIEDPVIVEIAKKHNVHPAVVCVKWGVQRGHVVIPFSIYRNEYLSNIKGIVDDPLSRDEMEKISHIDKNCRLIKGQVFLWKGVKSWEDIWR